MNNGTMNFKGTLESVNKLEGKKPYLKIKAIPEGMQKARTYNYHSPYEYKEAAEVAAHIEETRQGLLPLIDSEIAFTYTENPNPSGDFPFKNIKDFTVEFKAGGGKVAEEFVKDEAPDSETMKTLKEPTTTRPSETAKREEEIAKAEHEKRMGALTNEMAHYIEVAKNAWYKGFYPHGFTDSDITDTDKMAIQKIAVHLRMDKGRR